MKTERGQLFSVRAAKTTTRYDSWRNYNKLREGNLSSYTKDTVAE